MARFYTLACLFGLALTAVGGPQTVLAVTGLVVGLSGLVAGAVFRQAKPGRTVLVVSVLATGLFCGLLIGTARVTDLGQSMLEPRVGESGQFELVITGAVREKGGWQSAVSEARCLSGRREGARERVLLEVAPEGSERVRLQQGLIIRCIATIREPEGASDSGYDQKRYLLQQGVAVILRTGEAGSVAVLGRRGGVAGGFDRLREAAKAHLSLGPDPRVNEVLQGVVMGDTVGIDKSWMEAFRRSGTAHMLSVSGLHVGCLAAMVIGLCRLLRAPRWAGFLLAAGAAVLMVPFVGPSPPIIRSAVMIVFVLLGRWVGRGRDQWQILALAGVVILALNPFAVFDVGFQLSFSAFVGMMALAAPLQRLLTRLPAALSANVAVSLAAGAGTAPVALAQFGRTSLISPLANLLVVPALPLITGLGMLSVFAGSVWHGLSAGLDVLASLPMMWTVLISRLMAVAPVLESGDLGRALAAVMGGAALLPAARAATGRAVGLPRHVRLPYFSRSLLWLRRHRPKDRHRAWAAAAALVACGFALGCGGYSLAALGVDTVQIVLGGRSWPDHVEVRVLDVGQGNAILVRTPDRHALLFDGGPDGCDLGGQLRALGVRELDVVIVSHPHADHFAGLVEALGDLEIAMFIDNVQVSEAGARAPPAGGAGPGGQVHAEEGSEAREYLELRSALAERGCRLVHAAAGDSMTVHGAAVRFFAPPRPLAMTEGSDPWAARGRVPTGDELNAASLVAVVTADEVDVLLPGDAEAETLARYALPSVEIVVVPHHGSRGAVSAALLKALGVRAAIVSVGEENSFGHPDRTTVALLQSEVGTVVRTDRAGWVSCRLKGAQISITTERTPDR